MMVAQELDPETPYVFIQSACSNDPTALNDKGSKIITRLEKGGAAGPGNNGWSKLKWPVTYKFVRKKISLLLLFLLTVEKASNLLKQVTRKMSPV